MASKVYQVAVGNLVNRGGGGCRVITFFIILSPLQGCELIQTSAITGVRIITVMLLLQGSNYYSHAAHTGLGKCIDLFHLENDFVGSGHALTAMIIR